MFPKILHANDGSEPRVPRARVALAIAKQNNSELHMVSVEEIDYMPEFIEEVREESGNGRAPFPLHHSARADTGRKNVKSSFIPMY